MDARRLLATASVGLGIFVAVVVAQHVLAPELAAHRHVISEYANAGSGRLMAAGFLAWVAALIATSLLMLRCPRLGPARKVTALALAVAALGTITVAVFPTQAVASVLPPGVTRTTTGQLHDAGSGLMTLALLTGAVASAIALRSRPRFQRATIALMVAAVAADIVLLASGDPAPGIRQRILFAAACAWHAALLAELSPTRADGAG